MPAARTPSEAPTLLHGRAGACRTGAVASLLTSNCQAVPALQPARLQNSSPAPRRHAVAEPVPPRPTSVVRLERTFHSLPPRSDPLPRNNTLLLALPPRRAGLACFARGTDQLVRVGQTAYGVLLQRRGRPWFAPAGPFLPAGLPFWPRPSTFEEWPHRILVVGPPRAPGARPHLAGPPRGRVPGAKCPGPARLRPA